MGRQTAPARHRPVFAASQLSDAPAPSQAAETILRGVLAADVNLQRGFVTVQSAGRLQVRVDDLPASLQPTEWQSIPRALQKDLPAAVGQFHLPPGRAGFSTAVETGAPRSRQTAARARQRHHLHLGDFRRGRHADAGAAGHSARRQTPAASHAAAGREFLVCLRQPERRLALARAATRF